MHFLTSAFYSEHILSMAKKRLHGSAIYMVISNLNYAFLAKQKARQSAGLFSNVASPGIEPGSGASETHILSIVQRGHWCVNFICQNFGCWYQIFLRQLLAILRRKIFLSLPCHWAPKFSLST